MNWLRFLGRRRSDAEVTAEIEEHLAREYDENLARGLNAEDAQRFGLRS